jgi:hypothetical protein
MELNEFNQKERALSIRGTLSPELKIAGEVGNLTTPSTRLLPLQSMPVRIIIRQSCKAIPFGFAYLNNQLKSSKKEEPSGNFGFFITIDMVTTRAKATIDLNRYYI